MKKSARRTIPLGLCLLLTVALSETRIFSQSAKNVDATSDRTKLLLQQLSDVPGPPGSEEAVRALMVKEIRPFVTRPIIFDGLGSVIAEQGTGGPRIMIDAHMDEIGGMVRRVTPNGYLTMQTLSGILDQALIDQRWIVIGKKGPVHAISGIRDIHIVSPAERTQVVSADQIFLDIGARNPAEAEAMGVSPGDPIVPDSPFTVMNGSSNYLGKAFDDRVGCALLIEALRRTATLPHANTLIFVASVQEEIGSRGAVTASALARPDIGIALEAGVTGDTPGTRPDEAQENLGGGPAIFLYDPSALPNRKLVNFFRRTASERRMPLQEDSVRGYGEDATAMQKYAGGVPAINYVVPVRYTHSHNGIMNRDDFDKAVDLLVEVITHLDDKTVREIRDFTP